MELQKDESWMLSHCFVISRSLKVFGLTHWPAFSHPLLFIDMCGHPLLPSLPPLPPSLPPPPSLTHSMALREVVVTTEEAKAWRMYVAQFLDLFSSTLLSLYRFRYHVYFWSFYSSFFFPLVLLLSAFIASLTSEYTSQFFSGVGLGDRSSLSLPKACV